MQRPDYPPGCTGPPEPSPFADDYETELDDAASWLRTLEGVTDVDDGSCPQPDDQGNCETTLIVKIEINHQVGELLARLQGALSATPELRGLMQ